jgi:hypothetical protein
MALLLSLRTIARTAERSFRPFGGSRIDYFCDARKSTRETEFSMRGHIPALSVQTASGLAAGSDGARVSSVLCTAKPTSKTTAKTV